MEHYFDNIDEMHQFIVECYNNNIKYSYYEHRRDGRYLVKTHDTDE